MTDIGTRFTELQERALGSFSINSPHGTRKGAGVVDFTSTNGSAEDFAVSTDLSHDGTDDEHAASAITTRPSQLTNGSVVIFLGWKINDTPTGFTNPVFAGAIHRDPVSGLGNNFAAFRPHIGDQTDGNVAVQADGTTTTGAINYPALDQHFFYSSIVIDFDVDQTHFFMETNPFVDSPDATLAATPNEIGPLGGLMEGGTSSFDRLRLVHTGVLYIL